MATIFYTNTDEAPRSPRTRFSRSCRPSPGTAGVDVETRDISLAGRILALFPEHLTEEQRIGDALAELGALATTPEANIIKLPNVTASVPQLKAAIAELQSQGYALPDYPDDPPDRRGERHPRPLRQGQGQRRESGPARRQLRPPRPRRRQGLRPQPPALDGRLGADSKTTVATMGEDDFFSNEKSVVLAGDDR